MSLTRAGVRTRTCKIEASYSPGWFVSTAPRKSRLTSLLGGSKTCAVCATVFETEYVYQRYATPGVVYDVCSPDCRELLVARLTGATVEPKRAMHRIAVLNQKGGTGKTTTSVNLAAGLAEAGHRVLLIDADPQGHCAISLGVRGRRDFYDVLIDGADPAACIVSARENLDLLSSSERLASAEVLLARRQGDRQTLMRTRLQQLQGYDYVIVDCGPSLSLLNTNVLLYCGELLVPVACDYLSLVGVRHIMRTLGRLKEHFSHDVELLGFLPTMYDRRNKISEESVALLQSRYPDEVLEPIRINASLKEAPSHQASIFEYDPDSRGATDYRELVGELVRRHTSGS